MKSNDFTGSGFLSDLHYQGFDHYVRFPADMKGKLITALALGIMRHLSLDYGEVAEASYIEKSWKGKDVTSFVTLHSERKTSYLNYFNDIEYSDEIFKRPESWQRLRKVMKRRLIEVFNFPNRKGWALDVLMGSKDVPFDRVDVMEDIAHHLKLKIILLQPSENSSITNVVFFEYETAVVFPVVLAKDKENNVYLLFHKAPESPIKTAKYPFVMQPKEEVNFDMNQIIDRPHDPFALAEFNSKILTPRYNITAALANLLSSVCSDGIPSRCALEFQELKSAVEIFDPMISHSDERPGYVDDLREIAELRLLPEKQEHSLNNCYATPSAEDRLFKLPCGHVYHESCFQDYLSERMKEVVWTENPTIYCPEHRVPIPEKVLQQLNGELCGQLEERKRSIRAAHLGQR